MLVSDQDNPTPAAPTVERFWIADTETTGLSVDDGDRIIELGAVEVVNRTRTGRTFHSYINPEGRRISYGSFEAHGIHDTAVKNAPLFKDVYPKFREAIGDAPLVFHNAPFDIGFLNDACQRDGLRILPNPVIDSIDTVKILWPGQTSNLDAVAGRLDLYDAERAKKHDAIRDCILLAEVWIRMLAKRETPQSQNDLFAGGQPSKDTLTAAAVRGWSTKLL
ncbi:DNA polymerase III subunit epsilon [Microvirga sp. BT688]|uniref:exonuclease domain-containing protein n=1 Tax=Microvirga sp. TaxID=1873136 RepID=UPI001685994E|nr:exonuclease domain-containing protein [Microvirga sp.]MBD2745793.1 DNA polymerase III subunit epsilon [Microvirga sp.]